jgi:hypothetical protein
MGGGVAGGIIAIAFGAFSILQGPGQFVHFAQLLQKFHFGRNEDFGDDRTSKVLVYALLGKGTERGRLGITGNKAADKWEQRMVDRFGVRPVYTNSTGRFAGFEVLNTKDGRGLDPNGKAIRMLDALQGAGNVVVRQGDDAGGRQRVKNTGGDLLGSRQLYIDIRGPSNKPNSSKQKRALVRAVGREMGTFKLAGSMGSRLLIKRGGINFHFFTNEKLRTTIDSIADRNEQLKQREEYRKKILTRWATAIKTGIKKGGLPNKESQQLVDEATQEVDGESPSETKARRVSLAKAAGPAALVGLICAVKSLGDDAEGAKYANNVLPMMRMGMGVIAMGNQAMSGQGLNLDEMGVMSEQLHDSKTGSTWTEARSIQAELGQNQTGPDVPREAKLNNVSDKGDFFETIDFITGLGLGPISIGGACSVINTVGNLPGISTLNSILQGAIDVPLGLAGTSSDELMGDLISVINGDSVNPLAKGAEFGNLANVGTFMASNDEALAMGGTALSSTEVAQLRTEHAGFEKQERSEKSFIARYFDPYDYGSLAGKAIDTAPSSMHQTAALINPVKAFASSLTSLLAPFAPRAQAASNYDYGVSTYGFSLADQEDERFEDPYENAVWIESGSRLKDLNDKYGKCFGMTVDESGVLQNGEAVNIFKLEKDGEYKDCRDDKDQEAFKRYRFYIADTVTAKSLACYEGDDAACAEIGASGTTTAPADQNAEGLECPSNLSNTIDINGTTYYQMPDAENGEYTFDPGTPPSQRYGHKELVCVIYTAAKKYKEKYGDKSTVKVGDLNASGHASHKWGIAVDINAKGSIAAADRLDGAYSTEATIEFGKILVSTGKIKNIWWCPTDNSAQKILEYAASINKTIVLQCISGHEDHFHVDINAAPGAEYTP